MTRGPRVRARILVLSFAVLQLHLVAGFARADDPARGCGELQRLDVWRSRVWRLARRRRWERSIPRLSSQLAGISPSAAVILRSRAMAIRALLSTGPCRQCGHQRPRCSPTFAATTAAPASARRSRFRIPTSRSSLPFAIPLRATTTTDRAGSAHCRGARTRSTGSIRTEERGLA